MSGNNADEPAAPSRLLALESQDETTAELDDATQERLGRLLARYADELLHQPIPDVFLSLLAKLEAKERGE